MRARTAREIVTRIRYEPVREADFVAPREAVLDLYSRPYDARYPAICRDEQPKPLRADKRPPRPGCPATYDYAYVRYGSGTVWLCGEPQSPWRTGVDWVPQVQAVADHPRDRQAEYLTRVRDHLNTPTYASFYRAFPPVEARGLAPRVRRVFMPRHGSWLHRAEPELRVLTPAGPVPAQARHARPKRASTGSSALRTPAGISNICTLQ